MFLSIKEDALFVADSHFNDKRLEFEIFLEKLESGELTTPQLFLMGDMFDFISGESEYFINKNKKLIDLLNKLAETIEIIYLEGNHDYNLELLFPGIIVFKRENQPISINYENKIIKIAHGDIFTPWHYNFYCKIIRNHIFLVVMNILDMNYFISKKIYNKLLGKNICTKMKNFNDFAKKRIEKYNADIIIEGHFHQGENFSDADKLYVNIPSLCCSKKFTRFKQNKFLGVDL